LQAEVVAFDSGEHPYFDTIMALHKVCFRLFELESQALQWYVRTSRA
jgi:hypothetical protein